MNCHSPPGDLPDPGIEPTSPVSLTLQADSLPLSHLGSPEMEACPDYFGAGAMPQLWCAEQLWLLNTLDQGLNGSCFQDLLVIVPCHLMVRKACEKEIL